jgi:hypothetical protein
MSVTADGRQPCWRARRVARAQPRRTPPLRHTPVNSCMYSASVCANSCSATSVAMLPDTGSR